MKANISDILLSPWITGVIITAIRLKLFSVLSDQELQSLNIPTLYLVGENEKIYSPQAAVKRLKRVAPQIRVELIPNAGHDLTVVQADLINKKVLEFLNTRDD